MCDVNRFHTVADDRTNVLHLGGCNPVGKREFLVRYHRSLCRKKRSNRRLRSTLRLRITLRLSPILNFCDKLWLGSDLRFRSLIPLRNSLGLSSLLPLWRSGSDRTGLGYPWFRCKMYNHLAYGGLSIQDTGQQVTGQPSSDETHEAPDRVQDGIAG